MKNILFVLSVCFLSSAVLKAETDFERFKAIYDSATMPELHDLYTQADSVWTGSFAGAPSLPANPAYAYLAVFKNSAPAGGPDLVYAMFASSQQPASAQAVLDFSKQNQVTVGASSATPLADLNALVTTISDDSGSQAFLLRKTKQTGGEPAFVEEVICDDTAGCGSGAFKNGDTLAYMYYTEVTKVRSYGRGLGAAVGVR